MGSGKPVDWVSSSNDQDIVASAGNFALLKQGKSAAEVAAAFQASRRKRTPTDTDWTCKHDPIAAPDFDEALTQIKKIKILVVGGGWGGDAFRTASEEVVGVKLIPISFEELSEAYAQVDQDAAKAFADRWMKAAQEVVEPTRGDIEKSGAMYVAMKQLIDKHGARGISVNCLGGFYGGHMEAYPCLGFSQLNNDGLVGGCEADQMSAMTMATMGALVGRPGYISDPVMDTSKSQIIYAHCVAMTKPFGPYGASNPYRIRTHSEDRKGASIQSLLPEGYMTTTLEINPTSRQVLMHQAKTAGNTDSDMACRTKLEGIVKGDIEKLTEEWRMGWHRVTFYGDLKEPVTELAARLKLELIEEA
jgi:L-fucose isomerase-like protein